MVVQQVVIVRSDPRAQLCGIVTVFFVVITVLKAYDVYPFSEWSWIELYIPLIAIVGLLCCCGCLFLGWVKINMDEEDALRAEMNLDRIDRFARSMGIEF